MKRTIINLQAAIIIVLSMLKTFYSDNLYTRETFETLWMKICPKSMKNKLKVFNRNKFTYMEEKNIFLLCLSWFQLLKANVTGVRMKGIEYKTSLFGPKVACRFLSVPFSSLYSIEICTNLLTFEVRTLTPLFCREYTNLC